MLELVDRRGWNRGELQRALGLPHHNLRKALGKDWIYPGEQIRFSRQLRKIISGEVVLKEMRRHTGKPVREPVLAAHPEPLRMPMKITFDMKAGRCRMQPSIVPPENPLPVFGRLLENPGRWDRR